MIDNPVLLSHWVANPESIGSKLLPTTLNILRLI